MEKIKLTVLIGLMFIFAAQPAYGQNVAGSSATFISSNKKVAAVSMPQDLYFKKKAIKKVMEKYNSPMIGAVDGFMDTCMKYELNCYLLPSIAILESTFGKHIYPNSYNAFGWGGGYIMFDNWEEGIDAVGKGLRKNYINKGALTIEEIGPIYSESPTWAPRVRKIQEMFEKEEAKLQLYLESDGVQL